MGKSINKRQKIIILFFLGIGFPSLILGYLAFRGIRNDQALLEKERKSEHRQIAQLVTNSVADSLTKTEFSFQQILNDNIRQTDILLSLKQIKLKNPLIEEVFSLDTYEQIRFPLAKLPYRLGGVKINSPDKNHSLQNLEKIKKGQQLEFQVKDYDEALRNYRLALNSTSNRQLKAELLINIARVQKKANNNRGAIKTYKAIIQDYNQLFSQNGLILPLIASFELGSLYIAGEDTIKALQTFIDAYQDIIDGKFSLDLSQYTFYRGKIKEPIDQILVLSKDSERFKNQKQSYTELERADDIKQQCCERLDIFQKNFSNELINKASLIAEDSSASWRHFDLEDGKQNYLVSALVRSINHQLWGFIINQNYFKNNIVLSSLNKVVKSDQIGWIVRSKDRQILLKSSHDDQNLNTVTVNMLNNFPPWTLEFYQAESFLLDKYLFSRRSIYLYIFLLIGIILLFGLILSIRTVTHELQLAKMKSDFVSTISHEFKSPLTSIRQISEMLRDKRVPSEQRREKYYDILVDQSGRLTSLINNILDFSKLDEGKRKFQVELVDLESLLKNIITEVQDQVQHEGFTIQMHVSKPFPQIEIDKSAITQAISNLLDNAIKFSGNRKKIIVSGFSNEGYLIITVQDFGAGIKTEDLDKIFERFYRGGDEMTRTVKGNGLGLTIVKQIIEVHHGTVEVKSKQGNGTTFTIRLPIQPNATQTN